MSASAQASVPSSLVHPTGSGTFRPRSIDFASLATAFATFPAIDPAAVRELNLGNRFLTFSARFSGRQFEVTVPIDAVLAIYSKENGQGMMFAQDDDSGPPDGSQARNSLRS